MDKREISISQSFIKSYTKVYDKKECGKKIQALYLDKSFESPTSEAAQKGNYFEYLLILELTGEHTYDRKGNIPEPPKTKTGNVSKAETEKIKAQVQNALKVFSHYQIEVLDAQKELKYKYSENENTIFNRKGVLDLHVKISNYYTVDEYGYKQKRPPFEAIIDIKYSGLLDVKSRQNEYSFYVDKDFQLYENQTYINSLENKDNLTIQAVEYKHLAKKILNKDLPFFFFVASSTSSQIELIEVEVSESRFLRHEFNVAEIVKLLNFNDCKFPASPNISFCKSCNYQECKDRIKVSQFRKITI